MSHEAVLQNIRDHLRRIGAGSASVALDSDFEPKAGELVRLRIESAEWRLMPPELEGILKEIPAGGGDEAVKAAIGKKGVAVWHGPSPDSRDTSP